MSLALTASPTAPGTSPDELPPLRLVPAPTSAPPYDDEVAAGAPVLRLVLTPPTVVAPLSAAAVDDETWLAAARTPTAALPAAGAFARTLLQGVLEVLAGVRPLKQLRRDTTPELYADLSERIIGLPRATGVRPDLRAVRSVHVQERPEGVVEVCATVQRGARLGALALRLEGQDGRWRCTELVGV